MDLTHKDIRPAATSVATNSSTPGAIHIGASSVQGHSKAAMPMTDEQIKRSAARKDRIVSRTPLSRSIDAVPMTDEQLKPAASSVVTNAPTPGAVHVDASSVQGQQAFQNAKALAGGPSYYPEDRQLQQLPSSLEQESASSKRVAGKSHDEKADEKWKQSGQAKKKTSQSHDMDAVAIADAKSKRGAARKERVVSKTAPSHAMDTAPMTDEQIKRNAARKDRIVSRATPSPDSMDDLSVADQNLKRGAARKNRIASRSPLSEDAKQEEVEQDQYEDELTPGAVQVSGIDAVDSIGGEEDDGLTTADKDEHSAGRGDKEDNSTFFEATDLQHELSAVTSATTTIVEAQLVEENEREQLEEELRGNLEEEFRQKIHDEQIGQVAQAEVVEDDGSKTRRRPLRWACSIVILLAIILGSVLGTRDTSSNAVSVLIATAAPSVAPLNNSLCAEALPIMLGDGVIEDSLENAIEQVVVFCEFPDQPADSQRGLWYKYIGEDKDVVATASSSVALHVYPACDQAVPTCDITDAVYEGSSSSFSSTVTWTAASGVEYLLLVTSTELSFSSSVREFFELELWIIGDPCEQAFGPITPGAGIILLGATVDATIDAQVSSCGSASIPTAPGVWYTLIGDGGAITASTCTGTDFDSQISVFTGSCNRLTCVDGNDQGCKGAGSLVVVQSNQDEIYHLLVHGFDVESGNFTLDISTESCGSQLIKPDGISRQVIEMDARLEADLPELPICFSSSESSPSYGLWYRIIGTGNSMSVQGESTLLLDNYVARLSILSGPTCSQLSCVVMDCIGTTCDWESTADQLYYIFINSVALVDISFTELVLFLPAVDILLTAGVRIVDNDSCNDAWGPISPVEGSSLFGPYFFGSTSAAATIDTVPNCGSASTPTAPGVWYTIVGNGGTIAVSSSSTGTNFDSQISVFTGSCDQLACVDGNNDAFGSQSRVDFRSNQDQSYHVLVHGIGGASGNFTLAATTNRLATLIDLFVDYEISIQALQDRSTPQYEALQWMVNIDSPDLQATLSDDELVDRFVLVLFYYAMGGASWIDQASFLSPSLNTCSWKTGSSRGVLGCNDEGSIVKLDLNSNGLGGSLPTEIGLFSDLQELVLYLNIFPGTLPTQLGNLLSLETLYLSNSQLIGQIPSELFQISTLQYLHLDGNALTGTVPTQLGTLSSLEGLYLSFNQFTGTVPSELGKISTLDILDLRFNDLTGTIPPEIDQNQVLVSFP